MSDKKAFIDWVDPQIDTGTPQLRWAFSATACRPFGMVHLNPDTQRIGTWGAGYCYGREIVECFSHVHAWQISALPVMPCIGRLTAAPAAGQYAQRFSHECETVRAGYHALRLIDSGIDVELTATERVGFHRWRFPASSDGDKCVILDLGAELGTSAMSDAHAARVGPAEIAGFVENAPTIRRKKPCRIYFVVQFSEPILALDGWRKEELVQDIEQIGGSGCGLLARFAGSREAAILMKAAFSYCGCEQAGRNLRVEAPEWDFDAVRRRTEAVWDDALGRIEIEGGSDDQRTKFYTDLFHTMSGGHLTSDVEGSWIDNTGDEPVVRRIPLDEAGRPRYRHLTADIFWGAHWSLHLLWSLAYPEILRDYCHSLVDFCRYGGLIPRGQSGGNYTFVMIGSHSTAFLAAAYFKGIRDFDVELAYEGMRKNAFPGGLMSRAGYETDSCNGGGVEYYIAQGYVPHGLRSTSYSMHLDGPAQTLEYAYDDGCLAALAAALGKDEDAALFARRAQNYRNVFDAGSGFMRPRSADGSWLEPFDPLSIDGWCEANSWQYSFYVPHDVPGLIELMGGGEAVAAKLDGAFDQARPMRFYAPQPDLRRDAVCVNYGNEPGRFHAHLFNYCGRPDLAQKWSRIVRLELFGGTGKADFCEDDDNGLAAATSVMLALGLFDITGGATGAPGWEITAPLFERITIHLDRCGDADKTFVIEAPGASADTYYIRGASLNGQDLETFRFPHDQLASGGTLKLQLSDKPCMDWPAG